MKFLLINEHLETQIAKIKQRIKLSMNGVTADSMRQHGLIYKKNYGVAIPHLREIAAELPKNHDLAQRLWLLKIRETMVLATMIQPAATLTMEQALAWLNDCNNTELIEQINLNLFRHLEYAPELALHCISSATNSHKISGYILALRIAEKIPTNLQHQIVLKAIEDANIDDIPLANSIGSCLARFCRKDASTAREIFKLIQHFNNDNLNGKKLIYESVKHELIFLGLLDEKF
ncbi:MAG: DNA alkylation repair protein [Paludibacter sp.]|nr:DNA alkylation repair protein [Paludibacter sp.]